MSHVFWSLYLQSCFDVMDDVVSSIPHMYCIPIELTHHQGALKRGNQHRRERLHIYPAADFLPLDALRYYTLNGAEPGVHCIAGALSQQRVSIIRFNGRIENRAAAGNRRRFCKPFKDRDNGQQTVDGVELAVKRQPYPLLYPLNGVIESFKRELFLTSEMVINTAFLQSRLVHDVGERRTEIPLLVEDRGGPLDDHFPRLFAFTHLLLLI